jgi:hypothetical protein
MEIEFCERCDASIPRSDIDRGVARRIEGLLLCAPCRARDSRRRRAVLLVGPLALLAAAALGAAAAVLVLRPRLSAIDDRIRGVEARGAETAAAVAPLAEGIGELGRADGRLSEGLSAVAGRAGRSAEDFAAAVERLEGRLAVLSTEFAALKDRVREMVVEAPAVAPAAPPAAAPAEAPAADPGSWLELLSDPDPGVRLSALVALESVMDPRVNSEAVRLLGDADAVVRGEAAKIVGDRAELRGVPGLLGLLSDASVRVRSCAHRALEAISGRALPAYDPLAPEAEREAAAARLREVLGG